MSSRESRKSSDEKHLSGMDDSPIRLHPENSRYFFYNGKPIVLICATEHYGAVLNRNFDFVSYLDEAADKKATLSRCFLLFRELQRLYGEKLLYPVETPSEPTWVPINPHSPCKPLAGEFVAPFLRTGPGYDIQGYPKFDLRRWNPQFFQRLHGFLHEASQRGIIVELTLLSNSYRDVVWNLNPLNVRNNVNGVGDIAWQDYMTTLDPAVWDVQQRYVRKIVREVNRYNNIYFEVCNEPVGDCGGRATRQEIEKWQTAIRNLIRQEEAKLPKQHLVLQNTMTRDHQRDELDSLLDNDTVDGVNLHSRKVALRQKAYWVGGPHQFDTVLEELNRLWTSWSQVASKPLVMDEDNVASTYLHDESWIIHRKRAWTIVFSGGHYDMIDFSIQCGGQEKGTPESREKIRSWMKHLSQFIHSLDFVHSTALGDFPTAKPEGTIAATLAIGKKEWVIYLADSREINEAEYGSPRGGRLVLPLSEGKYEARLYSPEKGEYTKGGIQLSCRGEAALMLEPFIHDIVVHVERTH